MKPKLLQINVTANWGSTGKIAEDIGKLAIDSGWESWIAYGRGNSKSKSHLIRVGNNLDTMMHGLQSRFLDNHGLASKKATKHLLEQAKILKPDIIHLHNIHGYYINYPILFDFLKKWGGPVVWTLHDCWSFTGHCAYYSYQKCNKWMTGCHNCPILHSYPASIWKDRSIKNYNEKLSNFTHHPNLHIITVSDWLKGEVQKSFLKNYPVQTIYNGLDTTIFAPQPIKTIDSTRRVLLGVASVWDKRKGLDDFIKLRKLLPSYYEIILVGLSLNQISKLPSGITGIRRTENVKQLVNLYSMADIFINPSVEETLGMTTIEAMACGTPAIVYDSTASPEVVNKEFCKIVEPNDIQGLLTAINNTENKSVMMIEKLHNTVMSKFEKQNNYNKYIQLYESLL